MNPARNADVSQLFYNNDAGEAGSRTGECRANAFPAQGQDMMEIIYRNLIWKLNEMGVIMSFNGSFTQGIVEEIGDAISAYLDLRNGDKNEPGHDSGYDVFSVFIEQSQNIKNYFMKKMNDDDDRTLYRKSFESMLLIGIENGHYFISSGNFIENTDIKSLMNRFDQVNSLKKEDLDKLYKRMLLDKPEDTEAQSAGLGIIDMARRATSPLEYLITPKDDRLSFFTLKVYI